MSLYIDDKYIKLISYKFRNFKSVRDRVYNLSCPICGDSDKKKGKARGYFYPNERKTGYIYKCHNCTISMGLTSFLKDVCSEVYQDYLLEKYNKPRQKRQLEVPEITTTTKFKTKLEHATRITSLDDGHYAKAYITKRLIPDDKHDRIFFTEDFAKCVDACFPGRYELGENDPRIVLPFWDKSGDIIGMQGRALMQSEMRYITCRATDETKLVYGLDTYRTNRLISVVEGPFDSLFLENCVAAANSALDQAAKKLGDYDYVLVFDNEPRNREIVRCIGNAIKNGYKVCLWPDTIREKDINDMILAGQTQEKIQKVIKQNTYSSLEAELLFGKWRKV